jgi:hypothetical protein
MDNEKKNRSGSLSNPPNPDNQKVSNRKQSYQPGGPNKSNRQTGDNQRHERDDSSRGADRNTTKKGSNSI